MSNAVRIMFNLFADYIEWGALTLPLRRLLYFPASLICLCILNFNMVTVSKCLTGEEDEEGIKTDHTVQRRLSCLSVATKNYYSSVLKCPNLREIWIPAMLQSKGLNRCHLRVKRSFSLMASRNLFTWNGNLARCFKQLNIAVPF